ncbi:DUF1844 domain-containing protein [Granulicella arctica]|uniref:DUF1844 domain-containing protein n=1 Tax=Granulicella arctica TaxID=940613 RepID=A0A7Y9PKD2_9BACT|nr:DUF1844 domain-containing protein [Granulicella arctica]NYF81345.1 hypothetical protein [Granulicella arctica]
MSEQNKPFVVTDRRKFNPDGEPRHDAAPTPEREEPKPIPAPEAAAPAPVEAPATESNAELDLPPALTEEQIREARFAYDQTADRLDTAIRAANPGMDRIPEMSFDRLVQSVYMTAIMQLGGSTPEGEQPRIDLMSARQSIDMLGVLADKTKGNLSEAELRLLDSALFELRIAFLEVTQSLARSAQAKAPGGPGGPGRPSIVR